MNIKKDLYILEAYNSSLNYENGLVVALTPEVCYRLEKKGIEYTIIDDHYDESNFFKDREYYLNDQNKWFQEIDIFLKQHIDALEKQNLDLASVYSLYIKNMVDPLIYKSFILHSLFNKYNPEKVHFVAMEPGEDKIESNLSYHGKSVYSRLIPIVCRKYDVTLLEHTGKTTRTQKVIAQKRTLQKLKIFSTLLCEMVISIFKFKKQNKALNIFQLNLAYNGYQVIKDGFIRGHHIHFLKNDQIFKLQHHMLKRTKLKHNRKNEEQSTDWPTIAELIKAENLVKWVNIKAEIDVSEIVCPRLEFFITDVCPEILNYYEEFAEYYRTQKIDAVISPFMQSTVELAAIEAAKKSKCTKTFCTEHGDDILKNMFWRLNELKNFDCLIVLEECNKTFLEVLNKTARLNTKIFTSSARVDRIIEIKKRRQAGENKQYTNKNEIIYVPTFYTYDTIRIDKNIHLSPTSYYKFQKALLNHFSTKVDYMFIWKGLFVSDQIYNPIPEIVEDMNINNIRFETEPFVNYMLHANKVIFDYPSTGLYESVIAGIKPLCLYSSSLSVRKNEVEMFNQMIKKYESISEAIEHIDNYIECAQINGEVALNIENDGVLDIIENEF